MAHTDAHGTHTTTLTTPTGATHHCTAPPITGPPRHDISALEIDIGIALTCQAA